MPNVLLLCLFALSISLSARAEPKDGATGSVELQVGVRLTEPLDGGQEKSFHTTLPKDGTWMFSALQAGIDVELAVADGHESSVTVNAPVSRHGRESYVVSADRGAHFNIVVRSAETAVSPGHFTIWVERLPNETAEERRRAKAETATAIGNRHYHAATAESFGLAAEHYLDALGLWRNLDAPAELAEALYRAGAALREIGRSEAALPYFEEALASPGMTNPVVRSEIANEIGLIHLFSGNYADAERAFQAAHQSLGSKDSIYQSATVESNVCLLMHFRGDIYPSLDCYASVLGTFVALGELQRVGVLHNNLGRAYDIAGEPERARFHLEKAVALRQQVNDQSGKAFSLNNVALLERRLGNFDAAIPKYLEALEIQTAIGDKRGQSTALHNIGTAYLRAGDADRAVGFLLRALHIRRQIGYVRGQGSTLTSLAHAYRVLEQTGRARALLEEAVAIRLSMDDKSAEGRAVLDLAEIHRLAGDFEEAGRYADRAIRLFEAAGDQNRLARAWLEKGKSLAGRDDFGPAHAALDTSLGIARKTDDQSGQAEALFELAVLSMQRDQLASALSYVEQSAETFESLRARIGGLGMRASFAEIKQKADTFRVAVLMRLHDQDPESGFDRLALLANEKRLAQSLVDLLGEANIDLYANQDSEQHARRTALLETISAKAAYLSSLSDAADDNDAVLRAEHELDLATTELEAIEAQIRAHDPRIAGTSNPREPTLDGIQQSLDTDTVLLHFSLGEARSFLWSITPDTVDSYVLPPRQEIESLARKVHDATSHLTIGVACAGQEDMIRLSTMLLGPVRSRLEGKRLVIVGDGALAYVSFSALPDPAGQPGSSGTCNTPLLENHEIVYWPSATAIAAQRRIFSERPRARGGIAVFADPVYGQNDPRLGSVDSELIEAGEWPAVPTRMVATGQEARAIAGMASALNTDIFLGFDARKETLIEAANSGYRVLHLATHGTIDSGRPRMSYLLLSRYSGEGHRQDGYLRLQDIFDLKLKSDLVVLSGCETALGKEIRGEGFRGLTQGFMYAGARSVISSLWRVSDTATAEFMRHFYDGMINNGQNPAAALRHAKLKLASSIEWHQPYYWAAFVMQGDWR